MKKSIILYLDYASTIFSMLNHEEVGRLIMAVMEFENNGKVTDFEDRALNMAYKRILNDCEINRGKWEKRAERSRENGKKGGRPKNPTGFGETQDNPVGFLETQNNPEKPRKPVNVNVNVNDNVNVNVNDNVKGNSRLFKNEETGEYLTTDEADNHLSRLMGLMKLRLNNG